MSRKVKKASKLSAKLFGTIAFAILFTFYIQIAFGNNSDGGISIFGQKITFFNDLSAKQMVPTNGDGGGGGGGTTQKHHSTLAGCVIVTVTPTGTETQPGTYIHCTKGGGACYFDTSCS